MSRLNFGPKKSPTLKIGINEVVIWVKKTWTNDEIETLKTMYLRGDNIKDIAEAVGHTSSSVSSKAYKLGITELIVKKNNPKFKAVYQNYEWCYERYINRGMTMQQMADEAQCTLRVIQKWCQDIHDLDERSFKKAYNKGETNE